MMKEAYRTELTAPPHIFQHTKFREGIEPTNTFTMANTLATITTFEEIRILPDYDRTQGPPHPY